MSTQTVILCCSGILEIGQDGALANLLPLLRYELEGSQEPEEDCGMKESKNLFEGLEFCILIQA